MTVTAQASTRLAWAALGGDPARLSRLDFLAEGALPSLFAVSDIAAAAVGVAALALDEWAGSAGPQSIKIDRRLCSLWFGSSLRPQGWQMHSGWDSLAGDYLASDGWIRLHTNAPYHRAAACGALGNPVDRTAAADAVARWRRQDLEDAVVAAGGCAAVMHSRAAWRDHPQGRSIASEPLVNLTAGSSGPSLIAPGSATRPLAGIRVLDLTRVIAGPVASRWLAGYGAQVLRIDPPDWDDAGLTAEMSPGKQCARLDLKTAAGLATLRDLLQETDILLHGYRADALERLGLDAQTCARLRPGLVDVALNAYGWTGPWRNRRGFDSIVQMSTGIAEAGMQWRQAQKPVPLPVQALDHATGYLMAAAALRGLVMRRSSGVGSSARLSLARTAHWLWETPAEPDVPAFAELDESDFAAALESTAWGQAHRLRQPAVIGRVPFQWEAGAHPLGSALARWL